VIEVVELVKHYRVHERATGVMASFRSLFSRPTSTVKAVDGISFSIAAGERVGFLGPNGAGKTTTLKMLSGLLHPTSGSARVLGFQPWQRERAYLQRMTLVMGNRNQLQWDLPVLDSFELSRAIYRLPEAMFRSQRDELIDLLELAPLVDKPVRNLSLGERMKAEIANSLLHRPEVLFLDEPTLGLDVTMQRRIRSFLADFNQRHGSTVMLTTHYMADVEALCARVIVIHHGVILFDGPLTELANRFAGHKTVVVTLHAVVDLSSFGEVIDTSGARTSLRVPREATPAVTTRLLSEHDVLDLTVEDPPIDDVIELAFASATVAAADGAR
jgi:ABC-2 type transport system ATP-binding protein